MRALNIVLCGSPSHLNNTALRNQLEAGLEPGLRAECTQEDINKISELKPWMERVKKIDEKLLSEHKRYHEIFVEEANLRGAKRPALANHSHSANTSSTYTSSSSSKPYKCLPKRGLYTAPHTPAESGGLLQDSNPGLCWCDMGQICCFSPAGLLPESARLRGLRRTLTGLSPADSCKGVCRSLPESVESAGVHVLLQTPVYCCRLLP